MEKKRDSFFLKRKTGKISEEKITKQKEKRQEQFNKNREGVVEKPEKTEKKPFDKKAYRLKKYSKKYKLGQWEEARKKRLLREYQKEMKNDLSVGTYNPKNFDEDTPDGNEEIGKYVKHPDLLDNKKTTVAKTAKKDPFLKAKEQFNKVKQDKLVKQQEIERVKEEKRKKLEEYKKKKHDRFKKLSKKTKKGQPVMTGRLELLLEKIQGSK